MGIIGIVAIRSLLAAFGSGGHHQTHSIISRTSDRSSSAPSALARGLLVKINWDWALVVALRTENFVS